MKQYTVILKRTSSTYIAQVQSAHVEGAVLLGRAEVFQFDSKHNLAPESPTDYAVLYVLEGWPRVLRYGEDQ